MLVDDYAKAVAACITEGQDAKRVLASLESVLAHRGHQKLKGRILRTLARLLARSQGSEAALFVASEADAQKLKQEIAAASKTLEASDVVEVIDPTIIGGFVLRTKTKQLDQSYKSALLKLYRSVITHS